MQKECVLTFTGDIGFDKYMDKRWKDDSLLSDELLAYLKETDHLIVNVEGPLSKKEKVVNANGVASLTHSMDPEAATFLNKIGADVWNICNNHICDAGPKGISDTLEIAKRENVKTLGAGMNIDEAIAPVIFEEAGGIGLISVGYQRACRRADENTPGCFSWSDLDIIKKQIDAIKAKCRWCVVVAHAGEEFTAIPSPYTRERYLLYLEMGADVVVAHHPHVPMNYELVGDKAIFYSLGNFVFDTDYQRAQFNTEYGVIVKLRFNNDSYSFEATGIEIDRETETIGLSNLPDIFTNVDAAEYEKLKPLGAKVLIENTKRQLKFLKPDKFLNASESDFYDNFYEPLRSGRVPGETLDFQIIYPLSLEAENGGWRASKLENVKNFMLKQI